jgi:dipeptidyl aminopeptidase/acylaminoacyl peptidase
MAPFDDPDDFKARSPISYIKDVKTPMMFVLGESDTRTPPGAGGEEMFRALKFRKVPTVMVKFPGESHELSRSGQPWHRIERRAHRRLVRQMANGRDQAGVRRRAGSHSQTERRRRNEAAELV